MSHTPSFLTSYKVYCTISGVFVLTEVEQMTDNNTHNIAFTHSGLLTSPVRRCIIESMSKIPTQQQFNKDHEYPVDYGEDGDIAVGSNYTQAEAFEKFKQYWIDTNGEVPDDLEVSQVVLMGFGWGVHPDYANDEDNMSYILLYYPEQTETKQLFTGWVLRA